MREILEEIQENEANSNERITNEALYYSMLYRIGEDVNDKFKYIEDKAKDTPIYSNILIIIANAYESTGEYEKAREYFQNTINNSSNSKLIKNGIIGVANCIYMSVNKNSSINYLVDELLKTPVNDNKFEFLKHIADLSKKIMIQYFKY